MRLKVFKRKIGDMKKTILRMVLLVMLGMCVCLNSNIINAGGTVEPTQLDKIKIGMTEAQVKAILGEPSNVEDKMKPIRGAREFVEIRVLSYGSEEGADFIFLSKKTGKVFKVIPH
jgi:hypothetical protein